MTSYNNDLSERDIKSHYSHVIKAFKWVALLSESEAIQAIIDYKRGDEYSGEAVNHFGGIKALLTEAYKHRN